ncbi:ATP-binding protein [Radiobacillus sp. PE A8.2]|uniref:ATP-binding protein n=1 Tax=Radiobacillus sp. PE A8.2 TaxID=3380349 RepID=UPI00388FA9EB
MSTNSKNKFVQNRTNQERAISDFTKLPSNILKWIDENGFDIVSIVDLRGTITYISKAVEKILGYKTEQLIGERASDFLPPKQKDNFSISWLRKNNPKNININIRNSYGKYLWCEAVISRIRDHHSRRYQYVLLIKDSTDKKEAEEIMIRSEKMSIAGQLAAGIAHEIRNPLTSLKGFLQLLEADDVQHKQYFKIMIDEINKIDTITSELLFISKPMTNDKNHVLVSSMIDDVTTLLRSQANMQNISIELVHHTDVVIYCDRSQIKQVLINLIKNAIEEMTAGGTIKVVLKCRNNMCEIEIIDEGPGIAQHMIHKIKEPFYTTKKDGTGLGLMISNKIVENHHGKLEIESTEGFGSVFRIVLPIKV